jgi:hypothetical protein
MFAGIELARPHGWCNLTSAGTADASAGPPSRQWRPHSPRTSGPLERTAQFTRWKLLYERLQPNMRMKLSRWGGHFWWNAQGKPFS